MSGIAESILNLPPGVALALVGLLPALEASAFVGFIIPGETGILLGGVLANQGKVSFAAVLVIGIAGAIIGDSIGFEIGKRYGNRLLHALPDWIVDDEKQVKAQDLIRRYGGRSVFIGRFTVAARVMVPGLAGLSHMPYRKFVTYNVAGGVLWATLFALLGYAVGSQYPKVEHNATLVGLALVALVVLYICYRLLRSRRANARERQSSQR